MKANKIFLILLYIPLSSFELSQCPTRASRFSLLIDRKNVFLRSADYRRKPENITSTFHSHST